MKWVLVIFAFQINADNDMENASAKTEVYSSQDECDRMGETYRERAALPDGTKSLSSCIPESIFNERTSSSDEI